MNILMIGGSDVMMNHMIEKFRKEGHKIFLLTGSRYKNTWYERVFERYDFPYDAANLPEVFESVDPDIVVYTGAFDTNYQWKHDQQECVRYVSGMINLLMAFSTRRKGRFVYLSDEEVFQYENGRVYSEDTPGSAGTYKGMAIRQGEDLCSSYRLGRGLDIVTVRLDGLYYLPLHPDEIHSRLSEMCLEGIRDHQINVRRDNPQSFIFDADAVQFLTSIMFREHLEHDLYHLSSGVVLKEKETAELISEAIMKNGGEQIRIVETADLPNGIILGNERYNSEFGINRLARLEDGIDLIVKYMLAHTDVFLKGKEEKKPFWQRIREKGGWAFKALLPFVENIIIFIPFFMLNNRAVGSEYFSRIDFYLLYVLLFAIVYGQQQATFSAVLATAGYVFRQMYSRTGFEVLLDYNTYIWIVQLFIVGLAVGYMKDQLKKNKDEAEETQDFMNVQLSDIKEINESNVHIKNVLETQVVSQEESVGKVYSITSTLDQYSSDEVLFQAVEILQTLLDTKDIAIYTVANADYARLFTAATKRSGALGNSIKYREMVPVYSELSEKRVFINKSLDDRYPLMANAIFEGDDMKILIFIWGLPWEKMTLSHANLLAVASSLIQNAVLQANRYINAIRSERYLEGTNILKEEEFDKLVTAYLNAQNKSLTVFTLLHIPLDGHSFEERAAEVSKKLRLSDYIGIYHHELYVLLTNTDRENAKYVINRFNEMGIQCNVMLEDEYDQK